MRFAARGGGGCRSDFSAPCLLRPVSEGRGASGGVGKKHRGLCKIHGGDEFLPWSGVESGKRGAGVRREAIHARGVSLDFRGFASGMAVADF